MTLNDLQQQDRRRQQHRPSNPQYNRRAGDAERIASRRRRVRLIWISAIAAALAAAGFVIAAFL
jgi:hypothetical protein